MSLAPAKAPVQQAASNAQGHADDVRDPVVDVGTAVEAWNELAISFQSHARVIVP